MVDLELLYLIQTILINNYLILIITLMVYLQSYFYETNQIRIDNGFFTIDPFNSHLYIYKLILNQKPSWINQTLHQFGVIYHNNDYVEEVTLLKLMIIIALNYFHLYPLVVLMEQLIFLQELIWTNIKTDNVQVYFPTVYKDKLISLNTKNLLNILMYLLVLFHLKLLVVQMLLHVIFLIYNLIILLLEN